MPSVRAAWSRATPWRPLPSRWRGARGVAVVGVIEEEPRAGSPEQQDERAAVTQELLEPSRVPCAAVGVDDARPSGIVVISSLACGVALDLRLEAWRFGIFDAVDDTGGGNRAEASMIATSDRGWCPTTGGAIRPGAHNETERCMEHHSTSRPRSFSVRVLAHEHAETG